MSAYFLGAKPLVLSHSKTNSPAGPSAPVGLSMLPSASARSTTSFGSIRASTSSVRIGRSFRCRDRRPRRSAPVVHTRRYPEPRGGGTTQEDGGSQGDRRLRAREIHDRRQQHRADEGTQIGREAVTRKHFGRGRGVADLALKGGLRAGEEVTEADERGAYQERHE